MPTKEHVLARMEQLASALNYDYHDLTHLSRAMYCKKQRGYSNYTNDAMATLGDAVLKLIWSEHFFAQGLDKDEITQKKSDLENNGTLKNLCDLVGAQNFAYNDKYFFDEAPAHSRLPHREHDFYIDAEDIEGNTIKYGSYTWTMNNGKLTEIDKGETYTYR